MKDTIIRLATPADIPRMLAIYTPYVLETNISFECTPPTKADFTQRLLERQNQYPWLVYEQDGDVEGYAGASPYAQREAFCISAELSIYLDKNSRGKGMGQALYRPLIELLREQGYCSLYALIATPNPASEQFHKKLGFVQEGHLSKVGYKHNQFAGIGFYFLDISTAKTGITPPKPFSALPEDLVTRIIGNAYGN